ncbi:TANA protein, partial [Bucco capensis]|nr:TANA protein [Bucco capensis]
EESMQMWELNKRLEAYLARVKFLEEENEVLRVEIQRVRNNPVGNSWKWRWDEKVGALRQALADVLREKYTVELAKEKLSQEMEQIKKQWKKEQKSREEAKKKLSQSRKELEEEKRAQMWLKEKALLLEKELENLLEVHEEEKTELEKDMENLCQSLENFRWVPVTFQPLEVEDYSKRLTEIWQGAVDTYKLEVSQLENSLCQAKENLWNVLEEKQQRQMQLEDLEKELEKFQTRKEMLEENLAQQWQEQRGEAEKFQLALEALEQEKESLRMQIAQVLEERQQLMHLKMSLSLEVATYR